MAERDLARLRTCRERLQKTIGFIVVF